MVCAQAYAFESMFRVARRAKRLSRGIHAVLYKLELRCDEILQRQWIIQENRTLISSIQALFFSDMWIEIVMLNRWLVDLS